MTLLIRILLPFNLFTSFFLQGAAGPFWARAFLLPIIHDYAQTHHTLGRTPLDEWSARCKDLYLTTHNTIARERFHAPGGILPHKPSKRAAADRRLRPRSQNGQLLTNNNFKYRILTQANSQLMLLTVAGIWSHRQKNGKSTVLIVASVTSTFYAADVCQRMLRRAATT